MSSILIIDDDENFRLALEQMLVAMGHTVSTATDGMEGAQRFRDHPVDLVLTDMVMPHSGLSLIRILREQFPRIRMIAMTGAGSQRLDYARSYGAGSTLAKPFASEQLAAAIAETLAVVPPQPNET